MAAPAGPGALKGSLFLEAKEEHDGIHPVLTNGPLPLQFGLSCDTTSTANKDEARLFWSAPAAGTTVSIFGEYLIYSSAFSNQALETVTATGESKSETLVATAEAPNGALELFTVIVGVNTHEETFIGPAGTRPKGCWAEISAV
jgi:hypothetical protein